MRTKTKKKNHHVCVRCLMFMRRRILLLDAVLRFISWVEEKNHSVVFENFLPKMFTCLRERQIFARQPKHRFHHFFSQVHYPLSYFSLCTNTRTFYLRIHRNKNHFTHATHVLLYCRIRRECTKNFRRRSAFLNNLKGFRTNPRAERTDYGRF